MVIVPRFVGKVISTSIIRALSGPTLVGVFFAQIGQPQSAKSTPAVKIQNVAQPETVSTSSPRFEASSIKGSSPSAPRPGRLGAIQVMTTPGRLVVRNATGNDLVKSAYLIEDYQISGFPAWMTSARFDIEAKGHDGENRDQLLAMLRALLTDRFKLAVHWQTKELPVDALVVAKGGPKFHALTSGTSLVPVPNHMLFKDLPSLAAYLTRLGSWPGQLGRPVIDKTGLSGAFDLELDMSKVSAVLESSGERPTNESMYQATISVVQDELGLRLESQKCPMDSVIIDHVERPSEN